MAANAHSGIASKKKPHHQLGQFLATAVCGNDILSSALYVSGIAALFAGIYAPVVLLLVGVVLLLYRTVYREVVEALPVNGGAYNALLNSTSKMAASIAGTMTILSYIATAVISAKTAIEYLLYLMSNIFAQMQVDISFASLDRWAIPLTILVLFVFALSVIAGVKDSAKVAAGIFTFHVVTLSILVLAGLGFIVYVVHGGIGSLNWQATGGLIAQNGGLARTLFFGFAVSLLGVSGFESSANFVEEQAPGVFAKTLRNMALGVIIFNPLIAFVSLFSMRLSAIAGAKDFVLGAVANTIGGLPLLSLVGFDAFLVLCGAVLTGYVGVTGLITRMSLDGVLPASLTVKVNKRGSRPRIVLLFFALCSSILIFTHGDLLSLAEVYTVSFLSVMTLFAVGNLVLRQTRPELKRPYQAPIIIVILAALSTLVGLLGNIETDPKNLIFFLIYFVPAMLIVFTMLFKKDFFASFSKLFTIIPIARFRHYFDAKLHAVERRHYFVFIHHVFNIFPALSYIDTNEGGRRVTLVHCRGNAQQRDAIEEVLPHLNTAGVFSYMKVDFKYVPEDFSPDTVKAFAKEHGIPLSMVFIGSIHDKHLFDYKDFGGVRIILE